MSEREEETTRTSSAWRSSLALPVVVEVVVVVNFP
jgi:hypothetical protein